MPDYRLTVWLSYAFQPRDVPNGGRQRPAITGFDHGIHGANREAACCCQSFHPECFSRRCMLAVFQRKDYIAKVSAAYLSRPGTAPEGNPDKPHRCRSEHS